MTTAAMMTTITDKSNHPGQPSSSHPTLNYSPGVLLNRLAGWEGLQPLALFLTFALILGIAQFSTPGLPGTDGYYHIRMAELMRQEGLKPDFPYLPQTVLNASEFYNHHFLFHVLLIPFTFLGPIFGAKLAAVVFSALALLAIWRLLKGQNVPYAALWALGLLVVSDAFLYRMSLPRAQSLSLAVLASGLYWMLEGKAQRLVLLGFIYVWLYNAFILLPVLALLFALAKWAVEGKLNLRPVVYASLGIVLGLVINPYFPQDIVFILRHYLPKLSDATAIRVGNEWYPYDTQQLLENSLLSLVAFFSGIIALGLNKQRMHANTAALLLISGLFALMLMQARRFIEYFPPFTLAFAALAWSQLLRSAKDSPQAESPAASKFLIARRNAYPALLSVILLAGFWITIPNVQQSIQASQPPERYANAAAWLAHSTPQGSLVFQTDWDDFTRLFFHNTHNVYLVGLDPTYLQLADGELYDLWVKIAGGEVENPSQVIAERFSAGYVFTDTRHQDFLDVAAADPGMQEVFRNADSVIFQIAP